MTKRLVCVGDSITGASDLSNCLKWSHILDCMIEARCGPGAWEVYNRGVCANTTEDLLERLPGDVLDLRPDAAVLLIGGNDAGRRQVPREETRRRLQAIVRAMTQDCPRVLLLQYHLVPDPANPASAWTHLPSNNDLIAETAAAFDLPLLDMNPPMQEALNRHEPAELVALADGVHLNPGGELVYARTVFTTLVEQDWV